mgnify:CR=1 FL=1
MVGDYDELERVMERYGISRAFMFCMDEPDRHPAFRAPNDRTLAFAERSQGLFIPFVRLDLGEVIVTRKFRKRDEETLPLFPLALILDAEGTLSRDAAHLVGRKI